MAASGISDAQNPQVFCGAAGAVTGGGTMRLICRTSRKMTKAKADREMAMMLAIAEHFEKLASEKEELSL